ncbi:MAG: flagellar hook-length control protein FliK [Butyrivibrio sp.]|nr:flagellar hook-length control protein FliK [Butyrivibrio sp.]
MITNAIPGVLNASNNAYTNAAPAKGIAESKKDLKDFQKALLSAGTDSQTVGVKAQITSTLVGTGAAKVETTTDTKAYDRADATETAAKELETSDTGKTPEKAEKTANNTEKAEKTEGLGVTEDTEETGEATENAAAVLLMNLGNAEPVSEDSESIIGTALLDESQRLLNMLSEELNIDIKEIENVMATLGFSQVAILDPNNLTQIVAQLTNSDDVMAIVTNADLYMSVQNMQDAVTTTRQDLMQEFSLAEEDFTAALEDFSQNLLNKEAESNGVTVDISENPEVFQVAAPKEEVVQTTIQQPKVEITVENEIPKEAPESTEAFKTVTAQETNNENSQMQQDTGRNSDHEKADPLIFSQLTNQISSSLSEVAETENVQQSYKSEQTDNIMEQITEFIKISVKEEATSLELQLHPASLGTVNVMLEQAKNGNMLAKFVTQTEDVRAAIEAQLQQLTDKFNEQGVKVTAIEVTVNAGGFDQTLNDSQSQKDDDQDAQSIIKKPMRRINLGDLTLDDMDEIAEEDQLTAEMMALNGNSVDFTA